MNNHKHNNYTNFEDVPLCVCTCIKFHLSKGLTLQTAVGTDTLDTDWSFEALSTSPDANSSSAGRLEDGHLTCSRFLLI